MEACCCNAIHVSCCSSPWTCTCTVLEYNEEWAQLSDRDIDQLLTNRPLEACLLLIDTDSGRATEDYGVIGGVKNRTTRDLSKHNYYIPTMSLGDFSVFLVFTLLSYFSIPARCSSARRRLFWSGNEVDIIHECNIMDYI